MTRYAENTKVSSDKSRAEIERTLSRYGADSFVYGWQGEHAMIAFRLHGRHIKFIIQLPDKASFTRTESRGRKRAPAAAHAAWEQACRQRWRALSLVIKAKLEACESGISIFEEEFMANIVLPNGSTVGQFMLPQIEQAYSNGQMPKMLPLLEDHTTS